MVENELFNHLITQKLSLIVLKRSGKSWGFIKEITENATNAGSSCLSPKHIEEGDASVRHRVN